MKCPHTQADCIGGCVCEFCKVPPLYGYFPIFRKMKWEFERRFILEKSREDCIRFYEHEIAEAQKMIDELRAIPSKAEYERSLKDGK